MGDVYRTNAMRDMVYPCSAIARNPSPVVTATIATKGASGRSLRAAKAITSTPSAIHAYGPARRSPEAWWARSLTSRVAGSRTACTFWFPVKIG